MPVLSCYSALTAEAEVSAHSFYACAVMVIDHCHEQPMHPAAPGIALVSARQQLNRFSQDSQQVIDGKRRRGGGAVVYTASHCYYPDPDPDMKHHICASL